MSQLQNAIQLHRGGRLEQAEQLYRQILAQEPQQADALHLLGVLAQQRGNSAAAVDLMRRAADVRPLDPVIQSNLAEACRMTGDPARAAVHAEVAVRLKPNFAEAHNNLGLALMDQRRFGEALAQFQQALALKPIFALAVLNLGNAFRELRRLPEALEAYRAAVRMSPALPQARSNLGQLLLELGHEDEALVHCQEAVRLRPEFAEGLSNLGNVLRKKGRLAEAKSCYQRASQLRPQLAMPYNNMAQAFQEEGDLEQAFRGYQRALQLEPRSARIHCNLASALHERERHDEALARYRHAIQLQPDYAEAHNGLGFVLEERGAHQEAMACYREAIRLKPELAAAQTNLGQVFMQLGDMDQARACFHEAIKVEPDAGEGQAGLAMIEGAQVADSIVTDLDRVLATKHLRLRERSALHFALAHVWDARHDYTRAAAHLQEANALAEQHWQRRNGGYRPEEHRQFVDQLLAVFTPALFERLSSGGLDTELPVFVLGMPRSGTTLTEQVLASHPHVWGAGELRLAKLSADAIPATVGAPAATPPLAGIDRLDPTGVTTLARRHVDELRKHHADATRIVDKMPDNYLWMGLIQVLFPRARIIHVRRDLRDIAVSCWMTNFKWIQWACNQEHIATRLQQYLRVMNHWRQVLPRPILEIDYEDLVADLEGVARRMLDFCGLDWDPRCLEFHKTQRPVRTASVTQVRQPVYRKSIERWRKYEAALGPLFQQLPAPVPASDAATE